MRAFDCIRSAASRLGEVPGSFHEDDDVSQFSLLGARGFTTAELVTVLAIVGILAAFTVPQLMSSVRQWQVRSSADDLAALVQQARVEAERQNTTLGVYPGDVPGGVSGAFIGSPANGDVWQSPDPDAPFAAGVTNAPAASAPDQVDPGFTPEAAGTTLFFSPRGLPVKSSGTTYVASNGVVFYITDAHNDWAAASVSGAGKTQVWVWQGSGWH